MNKLSAMFAKLKEKWNELTKKRKIAYSVIAVGLIAAIVFIGVSLATTKYEVLFSNLDATDSAAVYNKLKEDKINAKVQGDTILVPKGQVDELRMQVLSQVSLSNGSQGFEILDKSQFGTTDEEMKINYQRAVQGELERTIKSFSQIDGARVHLVIPESTAFVKNTDPGSASVTLKMKTGQTINEDQVRAIIALISGAVKNIPKENVQVIDDKLVLLSKGVLDNEKTPELESLTSSEKQQELEKNYENQLEKKVMGMLEAVYGKDKVKVNVNADLDFDAVVQDSVTYDPKSVVVSEHTVKTNGSDATSNSRSPVDDNMNNTTPDGTIGTANTSEDITRNYNVSKVEQKTIKAPGSVKRLTTSVVVDGNIDDASKNSTRNLVVSAIGFNDTRGDSINVEGLPFDTSFKDNAKKQLEEMNAAEAKAKKLKNYIYMGAGAAALLLALFAFMKIRKKRKGEDALEEELVPKGLDVLIADTEHERPVFKDLDLEVETQDTHVENQIKKYAKDKPDQVVDIVKTWLAEDER